MTEAVGPTTIPRRPNRPSFKRLSPDEAERALYLDFEGNADQPPVLVGVLRREGRGERPFVQQEVLDPVFASLGLPVMSLLAVVQKVVVRAEARDRRIVSWSQHDLEVVRRLAADHPELVERFEARYANAKSVAQRWVNKLNPERRPVDGRLIDYLGLIEYVVPEAAEAGEVGETIRRLRRTLDAGRELTANQHERWERLLEHNRHDCAGMKRICLRAARELDAVDRE